VDQGRGSCDLLDPALLPPVIPADLKLAGWQTKYILKRALRGLLPEAILARRKQGFGVPIGQWLRGPLRHTLEERLAPARVAHLGLFNSAGDDSPHDGASRGVERSLEGALGAPDLRCVARPILAGCSLELTIPVR
jgi:hypothetical protein